MEKIMVTGVSAGVGKSTFAKRLGEALKIDVYHLDTLFWKPGWKEAAIGEFSADQRMIIHDNDHGLWKVIILILMRLGLNMQMRLFI